MKTTIDSLSRQQWDELHYPITIQTLTEEEGGGFFVTIPLLGEATCAADGESVEEALANLEELRRSLYEVVIASKHPLPLPSAVTERAAKPAGKWAMRASSELHAKLQRGAEEAGVSFNTYCIECLSCGHDAHAAENAVRAGFAELKADLLREVGQQLRREVRDELRVEMQNLTEEFAYERAHTAFFEAQVEVEPVQTASGTRRTLRENIEYELKAA